jgi:hypothetical protein
MLGIETAQPTGQSDVAETDEFKFIRGIVDTAVSTGITSAVREVLAAVRERDNGTGEKATDTDDELSPAESAALVDGYESGYLDGYKAGKEEAIAAVIAAAEEMGE